MIRGTESPPGNANGQREALAGCGYQITNTPLRKRVIGVNLLRQGVCQWRRHAVRYFLCHLPWGLDRLAWTGLTNPRRNILREEA
jgi:hypothetical protein